MGEGLFVTSFLTLRVAALRRCLAALGANLVEGSYLPRWVLFLICFFCWRSGISGEMVVGEGFEPSKSMTADLQSAPFGRSGTPPLISWLYS